METALIAVAVAIVVAAILIARRPGTLAAQISEHTVNLAKLAGSFEESRRYEQDFADTAKRIERLVAGSFGKGRVGENILASVMSELPPEMVAVDFRIGGRTCEFGLRMSDGKVLPIDSKWSAFDLVQEMEATQDPSDKEALRKRVESEVCRRIRDISGYIDTSLTTPLAVAAVPDAVYACCRKAHATAKDLRITIVSYSMAVPFVLGMWNLHRAYTRDLDSAVLVEQIHQASLALRQVEEKMESHLSRSLTAAQNAVTQMRPLVAIASASLRAVQVEEPEEPEKDRDDFPTFRIQSGGRIG